MAVQTLTTFSVENKTFYERALLKILKERFKLYKLAQKANLPKHEGSTVSWRKFLKLEIPTAALVEGVTPDPNHLSIVAFTATVKEYGDWIKLSNLIDLMAIDPVITQTVELFGEQIAELFDKLIADTLVKSCNVYYNDASAPYVNTAINAITANDKISVEAINRIKMNLTKFGAKPFEDGKYLFFITPEVEVDLKEIANNGFVEVWKYSNTKKIIDGEIGDWLGFRWIVDNVTAQITQEGASNANVHKCIVLGKFMGQEPFGVVELEKANKPQIIHKGLGSGGTNDPLNQVQTVGWRVSGFTTRLLYEEAIMVACFGSGISANTFADLYQENDREHYSSANDGGELKITNELTAGKLKVINGTSVTIAHNGRKGFTYSIASGTVAKATVNGLVVTGVATGESVITLTCAETGQTATVTANVTAS